jgi:hypothetical protein
VIDGRAADDLAPQTVGSVGGDDLLGIRVGLALQSSGSAVGNRSAAEAPRQSTACLGVDDSSGYNDISTALNMTVDFGEWKPQELRSCERSLIDKGMRC